MGPIGWIGYIPMFHRVPVDVIHVRTEVGIIADKMFPVPALPYASFAMAATSRCVSQRFGEMSFDQSQSFREIMIILRQTPDCVKVVGEKHPSDCLEGIFSTDFFKALMQETKFVQQQS